MTKPLAPAFALALTLSSAAVLAQAAAPPTRVRGTVESLDGETLVVMTRAGQKVTVVVPGDATVTALTLSKLTEIKAGSYIGTAAVPQADGTLRALEVQVFPERMRGVGEGSRPWDLGPQTSMTNGTVVGRIEGTDGRSLTARYGSSERKVFVPPDVPVVTYEPGSRGMLVPGAHVILNAAKAADGALSASRVTVGKDGLTPPM
jgi:Domain of unknown function (DUF5666)